MQNKDGEWFEGHCAFQEKIIFTCCKIYELFLVLKAIDAN